MLRSLVHVINLGGGDYDLQINFCQKPNESFFIYSIKFAYQYKYYKIRFRGIQNLKNHRY